jgi:predicted enzyme related to lactoylglutathione lyase
MPTTVANVAFDCADPYALAQFWSAVVEQPVAEDDLPGDLEASIAIRGGVTLFFQQVPEPTAARNRVHVCLRPEVRRDAEVERVRGLGATIVDDRRTADGSGWVVMADPEGNEFCVLRSEVELAQDGPAHV